MKAPRSNEHKLRLSESHRKHPIWLHEEELYHLFLQHSLPSSWEMEKLIEKHYPQYAGFRCQNMVKTFETRYQVDALAMLQADQERRKKEQIQKVMMFNSSKPRAYVEYEEPEEIDYHQLKRERQAAKRNWWDDE